MTRIKSTQMAKWRLNLSVALAIPMPTLEMDSNGFLPLCVCELFLCVFGLVINSSSGCFRRAHYLLVAEQTTLLHKTSKRRRPPRRLQIDQSIKSSYLHSFSGCLELVHFPASSSPASSSSFSLLDAAFGAKICATQNKISI